MAKGVASLGIQIDDGMYPAKITAMEETTGQEQFGSKPQWVFTFTIVDPDDENDGKTIKYWVTRTFDKSGEETVNVKGKRKLAQLIEAVTGEPFGEDDEFDVVPQNFVGRSVQVNILTLPNNAGVEKTNVTKVIAPKRKAKVAA